MADYDFIQTPRGRFVYRDMTRQQAEARGYGFHHRSDDGKFLIMSDGITAFAIKADNA